MCDLRWFGRVYSEFVFAKKCFHTFGNDEIVLNEVAFKLQQCVEKLLVAYLECTGSRQPFTHDISKLLNLSKEYNSSVIITDWVDDNAELLSYWEANSRYNLDFCAELKKIEKALKGVEEFLCVNGLQEELFECIDEECKRKIQKFLPESFEIKNNWEWNVFYRIYAEELNSSVQEIDAF